MFPAPSALVAFIVMAALPFDTKPAAIEHAKIELDVTTAIDHQTAHVDQTPPQSGKNPRPVVKGRVNESIKFKYMFTNDYPNKTINDVVVHFYVVRIDAIAQKEIPSLSGEGLVIETAHDLDFRPGGHTGGRATFKIDTPGVYLVRVESRDTQSDHEHFAAIDLVVEAK
jgi:hypothetical protein